MSNPTEEQIAAYIDDLVRVSLRHGLRLKTWCSGTDVELIGSDFKGYAANRNGAFNTERGEYDDIKSTDLSSMSAHERLAWIAASGEGRA